MGKIIQCIFSSEVFQGFECDVDLELCKSLEDIIECAKNQLLFVLSEYRFEVLLEKAKKTNFHIHTGCSFDYLLHEVLPDVVWICDHVEVSR